MLVSFALGDANFLRRPCTFHFFCVDFFALGSKSKPHFQWNIGCVGSLALGLCVGHVHFIFFVLISFASGTQRKPVFWWNMGFKMMVIKDISIYSLEKMISPFPCEHPPVTSESNRHNTCKNREKRHCHIFQIHYIGDPIAGPMSSCRYLEQVTVRPWTLHSQGY